MKKNKAQLILLNCRICYFETTNVIIIATNHIHYPKITEKLLNFFTIITLPICTIGHGCNINSL